MPKPSASLHIHEGPDTLKIYVPADKRRQEVCFHSTLPRRLYEWIMTDPATQERAVASDSSEPVAVIQAVLNAQPFAINDILSEFGVLEVDIGDREAEDSTDRTDRGEELNSSNGGYTPGSTTLLSPASGGSPEPTEAATPSVVDGVGTSDGGGSTPLVRPVEDTSRSTSASPSRGAFDMSAVDAALLEDSRGNNDAV